MGSASKASTIYGFATDQAPGGRLRKPATTNSWLSELGPLLFAPVCKLLAEILNHRRVIVNRKACLTQYMRRGTWQEEALGVHSSRSLV